MTSIVLPRLVAATMLIGGMVLPHLAAAADFGRYEPAPVNAMAEYYRAAMARQQVEMAWLKAEMMRDELERRRSQPQAVYCRLADGRFVLCQ